MRTKRIRGIKNVYSKRYVKAGMKKIGLTGSVSSNVSGSKRNERSTGKVRGRRG